MPYFWAIVVAWCVSPSECFVESHLDQRFATPAECSQHLVRAARDRLVPHFRRDDFDIRIRCERYVPDGATVAGAPDGE